MLKIIDHVIDTLEFVSEVLIDIQYEGDLFLEKFNDIILNEPAGTCDLSEKRNFYEIKFAGLTESLHESTKPMGLLFFPDVTDYSKEIRDLSQHFMDLFKNQMVAIINRLDFVIGKNFS